MRSASGMVSTIFTQLNQYRVILEVKPDFKKNPNKLHDLYVRGAGSAQVPLSAFTKITQTTGPLIIGHLGQFPAMTLSFNLAPGASLGDAVKAIDAETQKDGDAGSISGKFQGTAQAFQSSLSNEPILILAALITVYIVLGVLYESYIHPITILSTLPSAGVGAHFGAIIFRTDLSVIALIGIILLIGIVKKNGIMMVDFALDAERREGKNSRGCDLSGLPVEIPADHDDDNVSDIGGGALGFGRGHGRGASPAVGNIPLLAGLFSARCLHYIRPRSFISGLTGWQDASRKGVLTPPWITALIRTMSHRALSRNQQGWNEPFKTFH